MSWVSAMCDVTFASTEDPLRKLKILRNKEVSWGVTESPKQRGDGLWGRAAAWARPGQGPLAQQPCSPREAEHHLRVQAQHQLAPAKELPRHSDVLKVQHV